MQCKILCINASTCINALDDKDTIAMTKPLVEMYLSSDFQTFHIRISLHDNSSILKKLQIIIITLRLNAVCYQSNTCHLFQCQKAMPASILWTRASKTSHKHNNIDINLSIILVRKLLTDLSIMPPYPGDFVFSHDIWQALCEAAWPLTSACPLPV